VLDSGPVFSDIEQGCEVNSYGENVQYTFICQQSNQTGCQGWSQVQDPPGSSLEYVSGYKGEVNVWSGNTGNSCANNQVNQQTTYNTQWYDMSILYTPTTGQQPSHLHKYDDVSVPVRVYCAGSACRQRRRAGATLLRGIHQSVSSWRSAQRVGCDGMPQHGGRIRDGFDNRRKRTSSIDRHLQGYGE
jgi:hypothetical protein